VSFVGTQALADELGKEGAGVAVTQVMPSPYNPAREIAREYVAAVKKAGGDHNANFSSMEGYLAAKVMAEALRRGPAKPTRETVVASLEGLGNQLFGGFSVSFSPTDHVASKFVELSMITGDGRVRT
jgi:branched-chain amino acid transport system substrate-binding protein